MNQPQVYTCRLPLEPPSYPPPQPSPLGCYRAPDLSYLRQTVKFPLSILFQYGDVYVSMLHFETWFVAEKDM